MKNGLQVLREKSWIISPGRFFKITESFKIGFVQSAIFRLPVTETKLRNCYCKIIHWSRKLLFMTDNKCTEPDRDYF
jgi:hypothetical protein